MMTTEQEVEFFQEFLQCCRYGEKQEISECLEAISSSASASGSAKATTISEFISKDGYKALFHVCGNGHAECLELILSQCAGSSLFDVNFGNESGKIGAAYKWLLMK